MCSDPARAVTASIPAADSTQGYEESVPSDRLLEAERAAAAYWKGVAEDRRAAAASIQHRPIVRAAIAIDRRTAPLQRRGLAGAKALRMRAAKARLRLAALPAASEVGIRRRRLHTRIRHLELVHEPGGRPIDALVVDLERGVALGSQDIADRRLSNPVTDAPPGLAPAEQVNRLVARCRPDVVFLLAGHATPVSPGWMRRLGDVLSPEVAVAVPTLVHAERPGARTPHDLLTRSRGLAVATVEGAPRPLSIGAGRPVDASAPAVDPIAGTATCLAVDGRAWSKVGGLSVGLDADAAAIDLCLRIRAAGLRIVNVSDVLVEDRRPVARLADLVSEVGADTPTWQAVIALHGPALRHLTPPLRSGGRTRSDRGPTRSSVTVSTSVPSVKLVDRWGDWPFAVAFAAALRRAGNDVAVQTLKELDDPAARSNDVQIAIRGLFPVARTPGQPHVLWVISHPESITADELDDADLILVASPRYAHHVRQITSTPVEVFLQATDPKHFGLRSATATRAHDLLIVANSRGVRRRAVADAEQAGLSYVIVGGGWEGTVDPARVLAEQVTHAELPRLYRSANLVLNDHWDTMAHWGFVSNRVLDVLACGTPVASDRLPELQDMFDGLVPTWSTPSELAAIVDEVRSDPEAAEKRALRARELVLARHTFDHRAAELIDLLHRHDILPKQR